MNFEEYKKKKEEMIGKLEAVRRETANGTLAAELDKWIKRLKEDRFVVSVFGHVNNGKSTFLNALMGFDKEVLKEDVAACTAAVTRLVYPQGAEQRGKALLKYIDGRTELMDAEVLKTYTSRDSGYAVEQNISEVVLYLESPYLKNGVEIVDTPGFNSTYAIHTETALKQVENSDACIFMFAYDKPGSSTEFQFLRHVEAHMDKAFFVLNKIDLCEMTENTVENTVDDILRKMNRVGVEVGDKHVYPLSASRAKEAIAAHDQELYGRSGLPQFVNQLSAYLTSAENLRDRFESPLKTLLHLMEEERRHTAECIEIYGRDQAEQRKVIARKWEEIQEAKEQLSDKRKNIRNGVRQEIRAKKLGIDESVDDVIGNINTWLEGVDSIFSLNLVSFEDITLRVFADYMKRWNRISDELENGFLHIVEDNVDTDAEYGRIEARIKSMLRSNLNFERITVDKPELDYKELKEIDKKIEQAKDERNEINDELMGLYVKRERREQLLTEKKKKETEITRMVHRREQEIDRLSNVQAYRGKKMESVERTGGIFRKLSNKLFGKTYDNVQVDVYDDTEKRNAQKNIEKIELQMRTERSQAAEELWQMGNEIVGIGGIDRKIERLEEDELQQNKLYLKRILGQQEEKFKVESRLVSIEKSNYINAVSNAIREYGEASKSFLDGSRDKFTSMLDSILETEEQELERLKSELEQMAGIGERTPEELDREIRRLYGVKETLMRHITELSGMRRL